jgi:hypothetical protein
MVKSRPYKHYFQYVFSPPVHIAGFAGAPIVDSDGLLLGVALSEGTMKQHEGKEVEFGGEDATEAVWLYQHRSDGPAVDLAQSVKIDPPAGWTQMPAPEGALFSADIEHYATSVTLFATPKANVIDHNDLSDWLAEVKERARILNATNIKQGEIKTGKIGLRKTAEYEMTGEIQGTSMSFRIIAFEVNGCYCRLYCTTPAQISDWAQPKFESFVSHVTGK